MSDTDFSAYQIDVIDWRQGALRITKPDGTTEETILLALSGGLHMRAMGAITNARRAAVVACSDHYAAHTEQRRFTAPVASRLDLNPRAHGNITRIDTCECGAVRHVNINGEERETGPWS